MKRAIAVPRHDPFRAPKPVAPQIPAGAAPVEGPLSLTAWVDRYPPFPGAMAGGEWALHGMLKPLAQRGHRVRVVTQSCPRGGELTLDGVEVLPEDDAAVAFDDTQVLVGQLLYTRRVAEAAWRGQIPLLYVFHNDFTVPHWRRWLRPQSVTGLVWNTQWVRESTVRSHPEWAPIPSVIVRPPVWPADYWVDTPGFDREFVTLVNPNDGKGGPLFYRLAEARPRTRFLAVEGAYGQQLRPRPRHRNVEWQRQTPDMRGDVYARTRVALMPSPYESFGRVAVEAAASGAVAVVSDTPGLREALGDAGLYASHRVQDLDQWLRWLDVLEDREVYETLAQAQLEQTAVLAEAAAAEVVLLENLFRLAAAAETVPSASMPPTHDPFRRHAHTDDVSATPQRPLEPAEPAPATEGAAVPLPPVSDGVETEEREHPGTGEPMTEVEGDTLTEPAPEPATPTPTEEAGTDGAPAGGDAAPSSDGPQGHDLGQPAPEPASATTETGDASGAPAPEAEPDAPQRPALAAKVPKNATGDDGVVAWITAGKTAAEVYDRAEAAEWVEKKDRPAVGKKPRKSVLDAVRPILYDED